jgi:outer membrane immunogenic protein
MKSFVVAAAAAAAFLGSVSFAFAADMAIKAPVKAGPVSVYNWTGCYVGGNAGGIWGHDRAHVVVAQDNAGQEAAAIAGGAIPVNFGYDRSSWMAGGQAGCNYQKTNWVFGIETDIDATRLNGGQTINTNAINFLANTSSTYQTMSWIGTTRGRVGAAWNNVLFYGTGGVAYGNGNYGYSRNNVVGGGQISYAATDSATQVGWTLGGGIEVGFGQWSIKGEYLYYDLGNHTVNNVCTVVGGGPCFVAPNAAYATTFSNRGNIARLGFNYRFGAAPVVAKY